MGLAATFLMSFNMGFHKGIYKGGGKYHGHWIIVCRSIPWKSRVVLVISGALHFSMIGLKMTTPLTQTGW